MSLVLPWGGALATAALPVLPDAPARFSITMVAPRRWAKPACARRARASTEPPGGKGTMILIGPDGQPCACAVRGARMTASTTKRLVNFDIKLPLHGLSLAGTAGPLYWRRRRFCRVSRCLRDGTCPMIHVP